MSLKTVTAIEARKTLGTILNSVSFGNNQYIVERKGVPMAAIVPVKKLEQMDRARKRFFANMSKISDAFAEEGVEKLDAVIDEATEAAKALERSGE